MPIYSGSGSIAPGEPDPSGGGGYGKWTKPGSGNDGGNDGKGGVRGRSKDNKKKAFIEAHAKSDVDFATDSVHHTLGHGPKQAAPGNHNHDWPGELKFLSYEPTATELGTEWIFLDGSAISRVENPILFSKWGTTYGAGDGSTTFNVPDTRKRHMVGAAPANSFAVGTTDGNAVGSRNYDGAHTHTIPNAGPPPTEWSTPNTGTSMVPRSASYSNHNHGGATGSDLEIPYFATYIVCRLG